MSRPKRVSRWISVVAALVISPLLGAMALTVPAPHVGMFSPRSKVETRAPGLAALSAALALADSFVRPLYHPIGDEAVVSEYYGLPVRLDLNDGTGRSLLAGRDNAITLSPTDSGYDTEQFEIDVGLPTIEASVDVRVDWAAGPAETRLTFVLRKFRGGSSATLMIGDRAAADLSQAKIGSVQSLSVMDAEKGLFRSFRYTARHGSQLAIRYYRATGDADRVLKLKHLTDRFGFEPAFDIYAPLWGDSSMSPAQLYDAASVYHDCDVNLPSAADAYPYTSKICLSRWLFMRLTSADTLVPAAQALLVLDESRNADTPYSTPPLGVGAPAGGDLTGIVPETRTPASTAEDLEAVFDTHGLGIPRCLPSYCEDSQFSAVRTAMFGMLEAELGYVYHDPISRTYADAAASLLLRAQVQESGLIATNGGPYFRPTAVGGFIESWDNLGRANLLGSLFGKVSQAFSMSSEYRGVLVTNQETTAAVSGFLLRYRCLRFEVGCGAAEAGSHPRIASR